MTDWTHNSLLRDMADHCRSQGKIVFCDQNIGPAGSPRPDVLAINKSYNRWNPTVFEIKVSRSDFLSDVTSGKWVNYLDAACAVSFAVPAGLIKKTEVPKKAGLIVRHDKVWRYAKKPTIEPIENYDRYLWMALLMQLDGWNKQGNIKPRSHEFSRAEQKRHDRGDEIRQFLNDKNTAMYNLERLKKRAEYEYEVAQKKAQKIVEDAREKNPITLEAVKKMLTHYDIHWSSHTWESQFNQLLRQLKERFDADFRLAEAKKHIEKAAHAVGLEKRND